MFRKYKSKRSNNIVFVIFRLMLSLFVFTMLLAGIYSAYKHFSGLDPLKINPQAILSQGLAGKIPFDLPGTSQKLLGKAKIIPKDEEEPKKAPAESAKLVFKFVLVADSHNDNENLTKAITQAKSQDPEFIIGLGDYTEVGTADEFKKAKQEFDGSGLRYFLAVGDHDLWDCRNRSLPPNCNFKEVFGQSYQSFELQQFKFIIINNSDNYLGVDGEQMEWLKSQLQNTESADLKGIYVFAHEPLFHPSSDHMMGRVEKSLKDQAKTLAKNFKDAGVKKFFAGDTHYFSEYSDPETDLSMVTIGAITSDRNPQLPRFAVVSLYDDGTMQVDDTQIK